MNWRRARGQQAEALALRWLQKQGLDCIAQNFHCRWGELDLIMLDADILVAVEVRYRTKDTYIAPALTVDRRKQARIIRSIEFFLSKNRAFAHYPVRLDIIAISGYIKPEIKWLKGAFEQDY